MATLPVAASLLLLAASQAACAAPRAAAPQPEGEYSFETAPQSDEGSWDAPADPASPAPPRFLSEVPNNSYRIGAWGWKADITGDLEGASAKLEDTSTTFPAGYSFEWRNISRKASSDLWTTHGVLVEHFQDDADEDGPGGHAETRGRLTGVLIPLGVALDPQGEDLREPEWFRWRLDLLPGLRSGSVRAEVPDGFGGSHSKTSNWVEVCLGARVEYSPLRNLTLFGRGEYGTGSSFLATGSDSVQAMVGVRWTPFEHAALLAGWRTVRLRSEDINILGFTGRRVTFTASGPWLGLEVEF